MHTTLNQMFGTYHQQENNTVAARCKDLQLLAPTGLVQRTSSFLTRLMKESVTPDENIQELVVLVSFIQSNSQSPEEAFGLFCETVIAAAPQTFVSFISYTEAFLVFTDSAYRYVLYVAQDFINNVKNMTRVDDKLMLQTDQNTVPLTSSVPYRLIDLHPALVPELSKI